MNQEIRMKDGQITEDMNQQLRTDDHLTHICIPAGTKVIAPRAFGWFSHLKSVTIPEGVEEIGGQAFIGCENLSHVTIPRSAKRIAANPFEYCPKLEQIDLAPDHPHFCLKDSMLLSKDGKRLIASFQQKEESIFSDSIEEIAEGAFAGNPALSKISIPGRFARIPYHAFAFCPNLEQLHICEGVTEIGIEAFTECPALKRVVIPQSVKTAAGGAFAFCENLESVEILSDECILALREEDCYIPATFEECPKLKSLTFHGGNIPAHAFELCAGLTDIEIFSGNTELYYRDFRNIAPNITMKTLLSRDGNTLYYVPPQSDLAEIPAGVKRILGAFYKNSSITEAIIPEGVTEIETLAFTDCTSLQRVVIPDSVTEIGMHAFKGCTSLQEIVIPNSVTAIDMSAFSGCTSLREIVIPGSVTKIDTAAFQGCTSLQRAILDKGVTQIGMWAFRGCSSLREIAIPDSVTGIGEDAFDGVPDDVTVVFPHP